MRHRSLGSTGYEVSEVGFGAWAIGGSWGDVTDEDAMATLHAALDEGITFIDTADVYGDGRSEQLIARLRRERPGDPIVVATKAGRRLDPHVASGFTPENMEAFVDRSLDNLEVEAIDLLQLHCPPPEVYYRPDVFAVMDELVAKGKVLHYGVSVEKVEEALKAIEYPGVETIQIIFNVFRQRPAGLFFREAMARDIGVIARVPLASGMLTGKLTPDSTFAADDHRTFNRHGESFDVGETFAGIPYEVGLEAVEAIRPLVPAGATMAQLALAWILMFDAVSTVIPGGRRPSQVADNTAAAELAPLDAETMEELRAIYDSYAAPHVHQRW
jgi:aryl-alcohol dehydrogenase-like predicted oxidoreductase